MWKRDKEMVATKGKNLAEVEVGSEELVRIPSARTVDAVWGELAEDGPDYRSLGWCVCGVENPCADSLGFGRV